MYLHFFLRSIPEFCESSEHLQHFLLTPLRAAGVHVAADGPLLARGRGLVDAAAAVREVRAVLVGAHLCLGGSILRNCDANFADLRKINNFCKFVQAVQKLESQMKKKTGKQPRGPHRKSRKGCKNSTSSEKNHFSFVCKVCYVSSSFATK